MKFNCGLSYEEKQNKIRCWNKWFAWRPVRVGHKDCRWFEYVNRKERTGSFYQLTYAWDYLPLKPIPVNSSYHPDEPYNREAP